MRWGRDHPALRAAGNRPPHLPVLHYPRAQHRAQQSENGLIADPFLYRVHQLVRRNRRKAVGDIRLYHPPAAPPALIDEHLQRIVHRPPGPEPKRGRQHVSLEDRLEHDLQRRLHDPVTNRRNGKRPSRTVRAARLGYEHPPGRQRTVPALPQFAGHLIKQPGHPVLLDPGQSGRVNTWRAIVAAHHHPRALKHIPAMDLVCQRVKPSPGIGLGRPVKRMLQSTDRISRDTPARSQSGGTSLTGTHRAPPRQTLRIGEAAALPSPAVMLSVRLKQYYGRLRRPPGQRSTSRFWPVIGRHAPAAQIRRLPGRGGPPQFPPSPSIRSAPSTPGSPSRLQSRLCTASMAFALNPGARHSLSPPSPAGDVTTPQASRHATDRIAAPPYRAFDTGLRHRGFPPGAASLLPGLLAATRTGLSPAGDDELTNNKLSHSRSFTSCPAGHTNHPSRPVLRTWCWTPGRRVSGSCVVAGSPGGIDHLVAG